MHLYLERRSSRPLYLQVVEQIQERITSGVLPVGSRLPPIRQLAGELGLTRLTVHNAYAELQADGWIESFVGRGSYVAERPGAKAQLRPSSVLPPTPLLRPGSLGEMLRLSQMPGIVSFAQAAAAPETFPVREFGAAVQHVLREDGATLFDYGITQGELVLREQMTSFLRQRAIDVSPEQIVIVGGAQQGMDIALRALVRPGDTILVEQQTYLGMVERMQMQGLRLVAVPLDEQGIRPDALETAIREHQPRLLYTIPTFHNPTGINMSVARQEALLDIARRHMLPILEDDIYGFLSYDNPPPAPLRSRDTSGIVVYLTSFSKVLMPGLRLGVLAAAPPLLESLIGLKRLSDMHSPQLIQRAVAEYLSSGHFSEHLRNANALYRTRRDAMLNSLEQHFPAEATWTRPSGGFCCWVGLPPGIRATELYEQAIEQGVGFAPGHMFFPEQPAQSYIRLAFGAHTPAAIDQGIALLGDLLHEQLARRRRLHSRSFCESVPLV